MDNLRQIMEGCLTNTPADQKRLYEHYYAYCMKIVFRYIYRYDHAVDVVNDGFVKVFRHFTRFQYMDSENLERILMGWMKRIMINTAIDHIRKNNFIPEIGEIHENHWSMQDDSQHSDQNVLYKELINEIKKLPPGYRTVFNMYVIDGFTHQEIASQLGISVGTSKSNLSKARVSLQKIVKQNLGITAVCTS